jgi:hypothetical protein
MPIIITYIDAQSLNVSLQVGDKVYSTPVSFISGGVDVQSNSTVGKPQLVGILRQIQVINSSVIALHIDQYNTSTPVPKCWGFFDVFKIFTNRWGFTRLLRRGEICKQFKN